MSSHNDTEKQSKYPPRRIAGLLPFKAGQSGNPGGVKKGTVFVGEAYKRLLTLSPQEIAEFQPANCAEAIALRQVGSAIFGTDALPSAKEITDRTEGKAPQNVKLTAVPADDQTRIDAAIAYITERTGCDPEIARRAFAAQAPEIQELGDVPIG